MAAPAWKRNPYVHQGKQCQPNECGWKRGTGAASAQCSTEGENGIRCGNDAPSGAWKPVHNAVSTFPQRRRLGTTLTGSYMEVDFVHARTSRLNKLQYHQFFD